MVTDIDREHAVAMDAPFQPRLPPEFPFDRGRCGGQKGAENCQLVHALSAGRVDFSLGEMVLHLRLYYGYGVPDYFGLAVKGWSTVLVAVLLTSSLCWKPSLICT